MMKNYILYYHKYVCRVQHNTVISVTIKELTLKVLARVGKTVHPKLIFIFQRLILVDIQFRKSYFAFKRQRDHYSCFLG